MPGGIAPFLHLACELKNRLQGIIKRYVTWSKALRHNYKKAAMNDKEMDGDKRINTYIKQIDFLVQELSDSWDGLDEGLRQDYFTRIEKFKELIKGLKVKRVFE